MPRVRVFVIPRTEKGTDGRVKKWNYRLKWVDPHSGKTVWKSSGTKVKREAERQAAKIEQQFSDGTYNDPLNISWREFINRYETEHLDGLSDGNFVRTKSALNWVENILNPKLLRSIDSGSLSRLAKKMREAELSEATIKGHMQKVKAALNWANRFGMLDTVPAFPVQKRAKKSTKKTPMKGRPITKEEFERIVEKIPKVIESESDHSRWEFFLVGLFLSGLRIGESLNLHWSGDDGLIVDLDSFKYPMLRIPAESEKAGKDRILPITPDFAEHLQIVPKKQRRGRVFSLPGRNGEELLLDAVSKKVCKLGKLAGVKVSKTKFASAHDFRRSFGDRWAKEVPMHYLQQLMRHESLDTTMRYYVGQNSEQVSESLYASTKRSPKEVQKES